MGPGVMTTPPQWVPLTHRIEEAGKSVPVSVITRIDAPAAAKGIVSNARMIMSNLSDR